MREHYLERPEEKETEECKESGCHFNYTPIQFDDDCEDKIKPENCPENVPQLISHDKDSDSIYDKK